MKNIYTLLPLFKISQPPILNCGSTTLESWGLNWWLPILIHFTHKLWVMRRTKITYYCALMKANWKVPSNVKEFRVFSAGSYRSTGSTTTCCKHSWKVPTFHECLQHALNADQCSVDGFTCRPWSRNKLDRRQHQCYSILLASKNSEFERS